MQTPPFQLARSSSEPLRANALHPLHERCCEPAQKGSAAPATARRKRLAELDTNIHCSLIGTCLTTAELRKLVPRYTTLDRDHATDLDIHHAAVELASQGGEGAKALHKALDQRYAVTLKRFGAIHETDALQQVWTDAIQSGEVPPAYWAIMTHPATTPALRQRVFGDVHMLSHLVGAANRADIRRLVALEDENAALHAKIERQQQRLQAMATARDFAERQLRGEIDRLKSMSHLDATDADVSQLRRDLAERDESVALHASRCETAEQRLKQERERAEAVEKQLEEAQAAIEALKNEADAMEHTFMRTMTDNDTRPGPAWIRGRRIVYVGGRPGTNAAIKQLVEAAGGWLIAHDGGIEDRKGMLAALIPGADLVLFPVDCIDHDSMNTLKRICERSVVEYRALRTASVASFVASIAQPPGSDMQRGAPAFCLRHG